MFGEPEGAESMAAAAIQFLDLAPPTGSFRDDVLKV